jgi:transposase InsO family protein
VGGTLEPIRQGGRHAFGAFRKDVDRGLAIRCDWGPQYIADAWSTEVKWLGIAISPSYVGEPECNGVIERFMRTLKEQCLYLHRFRRSRRRGRSSPSSSKLQRRVADRAPGLSDADTGARRGLEGRSVRIWPIRPDVEGRSASRSAFDAGGRNLGIPRNGTFSGLTSVQRIRVRPTGTHRLDLAGRTAAQRRWRLSFLGARFRGQQHVPVEQPHPDC